MDCLHRTKTYLGIFQHESTTNITHFVLQLPCKSIATILLGTKHSEQTTKRSRVMYEAQKENNIIHFTFDVKETFDAIMISMQNKI